ncbi:TetR/AcrR family transcriptional regulator [Pseudonocardia sp. KRD291]|uniref:TetR/AcrR family transcriptional regulator n=1 Tax=Pseudonocardia sp. KRD291 TaxID=2792007 RepID=UPI001C5C1516|nr:TetR/AcrR family transcriptional regulator [Pseudonocardia sp. KRD291]MBW0101625.1 TetR/AcrR family transcriptional regulator [Pseudonocardia sp. KRD291]
MRDSPRTRPAKPALSRESIVGAALRLIDAHGVAGVTMRAVAKEVDTSPGALYVYVADRDELIALAHDEAVAGVELPTDADGDWRERLELLVRRTVAALAEHSDLGSFGLTHLDTGPGSLRIVEEILSLLLSGGIEKQACAWAADLIGQYISSAALEDVASRARDDDPATSTVSALYSGLPEERYPTLRLLTPQLTAGDPAQRAAWKLQVILNGVIARAQ